MSDYRTTQAQCPLCGALMDARTAGDALVDVCPACQAVWIDWFDGAPADVAAATGPLPISAQGGRGGSGACPRCTVPLAREWLTEVAQVLRCGDCAGVLVPRASFDELVRAHASPPDPPAPPTALARLANALRDVLRMFALD